MGADPVSSPISPDAYLTLEAASETRHEYVDGYVYAMAGGTLAHDRIANNLRALLDVQLGDGPCVTFGPDVRLRINHSVYSYPDAEVICAEALDDGALEITAPRLIGEVLSDTTEANDRGDIFAHYQTLATLEEYVLVSSRRRMVESFRRGEHGLWLYRLYNAEAVVTLESLGLSFPVASLYRRTTVA